jgi:hypothetical protein
MLRTGYENEVGIESAPPVPNINDCTSGSVSDRK